MRLLISLVCLRLLGCLAYGQADSPLMHPLVGITFPLSPGHSGAFATYMITKTGVGWSEWVGPGDASAKEEIRRGGVKGGHTPDTNATAKAAQSVELLKGLAQPEHLSESPGQILTARWFEGDKTLEKKFPIEQVPSEIRRVLLLMRCPERDLKRLKFIRTH